MSFDWAGIVEREGSALGDAAAADLAAPIPAAPGWDAVELLRHVGLVQSRATVVLRTATLERPTVENGMLAAPPTVGVVEWYLGGLSDLVAAIGSAEPEPAIRRGARLELADRNGLTYGRRYTYVTLTGDDHGHERDPAHAHLLHVCGELRVGVDVDLGQHPAPGALARELLQDRAELLARTAPLRPEIDEDGLAGVDGLLERAVREDRDLLRCHCPMSLYTL